MVHTYVRTAYGLLAYFSNFTQMDSHGEEIDLFLREIQQQILLPMRIDRTGQVPAIVVKDLCIYLYPPYTSRRENVAALQTIHIDVDQIRSSSQKIINRLKGMLGLGTKVYARNTVVARIDKKVAMEFQEEHHLQVALPGKYRYGLYHEGELVSIAIFSGGRRMSGQSDDYRSFELLRFCHKGAYTAIGGISKLIRQFALDFRPSDIMTYADLDWCQQSSLERIGFRPETVKSPQTFYIDNGERHYIQGPQGKGYTVQNSGSLKLKLIL